MTAPHLGLASGQFGVDFPAPLPAADAVTTSGFSTALDRVLSLVCLVSLVPLAVVARTLPADLSRVWLIVLGGAFVASSALLPVYAWSRRGIKPLAALYAAAVALAAATWPLVGAGNDVPAPIIVVSFLLGLGGVCLSVVTSTRVAIAYVVMGGLWMVFVRLSPAGGSAPPMAAALDGLQLITEGICLLLIVSYLRRTATNLDSQQIARYAETTEAAVNEALFAERRRLDAIIHDEVMTTLVAAAGDATGTDGRVAQLAEEALATLTMQGASDDRGEVSTDQLARLVKDVVCSVCPRAEVLAELPAPPTAVSASATRTLLQATREAALNAEKHSAAKHIQVLLSVETRGRRVSVRVSVADDGVGFDPGAVPDGRLGLRVALAGRLETIGGRAEIASRPGKGTTVRLSWAGEGPRDAARERAPMKAHPLFTSPPPPSVGYAALVVAALHLLEAIYVAPLMAVPLFLALAAALAMGGLAFGAGALFSSDPPRWWSWAGAVLLVGASVAGMSALPGGEWPRYSTWFVILVAAGAVLLYAGGARVLAWVVAGVHAVAVLAALFWFGGFGPGGQVGVALLAALEPTFWVGVEAVAFRWMRRLWSRVDELDRSVAEGARVNASMFSKTVLQEVWLNELSAEVVPALRSIADTTRPTSDSERIDFLLIEGSLRDQIKAANLASPQLSAAIRQARRRGVEVNLVDNRGGRLPSAARRAAMQAIQDVVTDALGGKIVARTAPPGYHDAVTIVHVTQSGETRLTRVNADGRVTTNA